MAQALSMVNRAVSPNNTLPVLNNILLKAEGKRLFLSATNLEIAIKASFAADVRNEGTLTVPAKVFNSYVSLLGEENIEMEVTGGATLNIKSTGSKTDMKGISAEEFPRLPKLDGAQSFKLPTKHLQGAIDQVAFAASTNISRPVLTGMYWQVSGKTLKLAATDSYRLAEKTIQLEQDTGMELSFILPSKTAQEVAKILGSTEEKEMEVQVAKGQILFKVDGVELISRLIDGNFPDYEKILPKECKTLAKLATEDFILGLKKVSVIVRENSNNVKVKLENGKVLIYTDETQVGKGSAELPVSMEGDTVEAALNVQYLLEVLGHLEDKEVHFGLNDKLSPVRVVPADKASGYLHIIMPLKI